MFRQVLPRPSAFGQWLLTGSADRSAAEWRREEPIDEDDESIADDADRTEENTPEDTDEMAAAVVRPQGFL